MRAIKRREAGRSEAFCVSWKVNSRLTSVGPSVCPSVSMCCACVERQRQFDQRSREGRGQTELSFFVASLSIYSARVSVVSIVVVRVTLD